MHLDKFKPYCKPNEKPCYISKESNYPPVILKNLVSNVGRRISLISSSETTFHIATPCYNNEFRESGFSDKIQYYKTNFNNNRQHRTRTRKVLWFKPAFNIALKTTVGIEFLNLVSKHFQFRHKL